MGYLTFFVLIAAIALVVPAAVLALGLAQRAAGSAEPWQRLDRARLAFSILPHRVRKATVALAIVLPTCIFVGAMIASVGGAFYPPAVEIAVPYVCNGAPESRTQDYSYRPGQAGVAHNFQCTDAGGDRREDGLSPREFGQLLCLHAIYPQRIAQLMDLTAPPLVPLDIRTVPIAPLRAAYPDDWQQAGYQALFSPDKSLLALGIEDSAGYVMQVWLYQPASGKLTVASPPTHKGGIEAPDDIADLAPRIWGDDGRIYIRADRPLGEDSIFAADIDGYTEVRDLPANVTEALAANGTTSGTAVYNSELPEQDQPPGFDDDSYNEQDGGAFTAWAQNRGHGSFELLAARAGDTEPRRIAGGGWELEDFQFDPTGTRLVYNGENGLVVTDPESGTTRRLQGTRGISVDVRPIGMSADGNILVYWAVGSCTSDATDEIDPDDDDTARRVCLAYLAPAATADAAPADPWVGEWTGSGESSLSASIRRGTAKPDYLVIDLATGMPGCSGAVTLYGRPEGATVHGESYDPNDPAAPVCGVGLSLDGDVLKTEVAGPCTYYHGAACGFDGTLTQSK